jgi:hypothetical protein
MIVIGVAPIVRDQHSSATPEKLISDVKNLDQAASRQTYRG